MLAAVLSADFEPLAAAVWSDSVLYILVTTGWQEHHPAH